MKLMMLEKEQSIFLECREEQGQRKLKKASKLIFDLNLKAKHIVLKKKKKPTDHPFFYLTFRLCSSSIAKRDTRMDLECPRFLELTGDP